jgi:hypothetical protein
MLSVSEPDDLGARVELLQRTRAGIVEARVAPACWSLRAPNLDARVVPVDVLPLQPSDLAGAQTAVEGECRSHVREDPFRLRPGGLEEALLIVIRERLANGRLGVLQSPVVFLEAVLQPCGAQDLPEH